MSPDRILVFAPHSDDEVLGCGGYLALRQKEGARIRVVVVTDGARGLAGDAGRDVRGDECRAGLARLGVTDAVFWNQPDGRVPLSGPIREAYRREVLGFRPHTILLPAPSESHDDHRRVTRGLLAALEGVWQGTLYFFETTTPAASVNYSVDITPVMDAKLAALAAHVSQLARFDYREHCLALGRLRGVAVGSRYAEAFLAYAWDGSPQNFFESRPLISVIVRADDAGFLRHALASLVAQEYDQLEVILVWFGAAPPGLDEFTALDLRPVAGGTGRGRNLNLGLAAARGEYIAFLDQDDVLDPSHFALLLGELHGRPEVDFVYAGCRLVSCRRVGDQVERVGALTVIHPEYRPGRVLLGNRVPNHAVLFRAGVFRDRRYDETLGAYEDWDMLARLELEGGRCLRSDGVTCEYRLFGPEGVVSLDQLHTEKGYTPWGEVVSAHIAARLAPRDLRHLRELVDALETDRARLETEREALERKARTVEERVAEMSSVHEMLARGLGAVAIDKEGRRGAAELLGRVLPAETLFSILLPVRDTPGEILAETLLSVRNQAYPGWELCVVDDASGREETRRILSALARDLEGSGRLRLRRRERHGGIVAATMDALALATAPYVVFLDHDDLLHEEALLSLALILKTERAYRLLYTDSRSVDRTGLPLHVYHKPGWAPETLLHLNYINHLTVVERALLEEIGGLRPAHEGAQDWDLLLRLGGTVRPAEIRHVPEALYDWRATEDSLAYAGAAKPWAYEAAREVLKAHLEDRGLVDVRVESNPDGPGFLSHWEADPRPVEVVIPTHDNLRGLEACVRGLREQTGYPQLSITIVANRSRRPEMRAFLDELARSGAARVLFDDRPFNWAALNNRAITNGTAPWILCLNDDVEIQDPHWLPGMCRYLQLDGVGAVGATLFYPNGELQHNGIWTHARWVAGNITSWGARNELRVPRNVSAVTGACLLTRRDLFDKLGGFEERLAVSFNDVDYCLALRALGWRIVQTPDVRLLHHESASRGRPDSPESRKEVEDAAEFMRTKWGEFLREEYIPTYEIAAGGTRILHLP